MVMEAVAVKVKNEDRANQKKADEAAERAEWKKKKEQELKELVG